MYVQISFSNRRDPVTFYFNYLSFKLITYNFITHPFHFKTPNRYLLSENHNVDLLYIKIQS